MKIWLSPSEIKKMISSTVSWEERMLIWLGAYSGLRINEIAKARFSDIFFQEYAPEKYNIKIRIEGKKTRQKKGEGKFKIREALLPQNVYHDLVLQKNSKVFVDYIFPSREKGKKTHLTVDRMRQKVKEIAVRADLYVYETSSGVITSHVSSHALRRFYAHSALVEKRINPKVVMETGGWENYKSIEPYLTKPSEKSLYNELKKFWEDM